MNTRMIKNEKMVLPADFTKKVMAKIDDEIVLRRKKGVVLLYLVGIAVVAVIAISILMIVKYDFSSIGNFIGIINDNITQVIHSISVSIYSSLSGLFSNFVESFLQNGGFSIPLPIIVFFNVFILMIGYILVERRINSAKSARK
jgi:hypothetical protein